ncbi:MAG: hypothetical protein K9G44_13340, partial [Melioribacteraceae bacterium]|nr:hypothetical protein [Melioribacteraceae bacterium]
MKLFYKVDSIITKYNILILLIVVLQSTYIISFAQEKSFENSNFVLDFEMNNYSMDDVKEHFFTTYPHNDPTEGDVVYDRVRWENKDLIQLNNEDGLFLYIKKREADSNFDSFRLTSKSYYNLYSDEHKIMFVFKGKLPSGNSVWPAWWLNGGREAEWLYEAENILMEDSDLDLFSGVGEFYNTSSQVNSTDWPGAGEIDIIENINGQKLIHNTIHACPSMCDSEWNGDGEIINCANAKDGDPNAGCSG